MKAKIPNLWIVCKYLVGILLAGGLLYLALKDVPLATLSELLGKARWEWVLLGLIPALLSHWLRGYRWKMLFNAAGIYNISTANAFWAVMVGYMVNNVFPRLGEVTRCSILLKSNNIPIAISVGAVLAERVIDLLSLMLLTMALLALEFDMLKKILGTNIEKLLQVNLQNLFFIAIGGTLAVAIAIAIFWRTKKKSALRKIKLFDKAYIFIVSLLGAIASVKKIQHPFLFVGVSFLIWLGYITAIYFIFRALPQFEQYEKLNFYFAFITTVVGGIAMTLPVPGGIGTFHSAVKITFLTYGISNGLGEVTAILAHTSGNLIMNTVFGILGYLYLVLVFKNKNLKT
jgi:uncharacterized protein (TIRG00374 family)